MVEVLLSVAVIGIISGLVIAQVSSLSREAAENRKKFNAQLVASMAANAQAAGNQSIAEAADAEAAVALIADGVFGGGEFAATTYRLALGEEERKEILPLLVFGGGKLLYTGDGG